MPTTDTDTEAEARSVLESTSVVATRSGRERASVAPRPRPASAVALAMRQAALRLMQMSTTVAHIVGCADAVDFEERKALLEEIGKVIDPVIFEIVSEGAEHSHEIEREDGRNFLSDMIHDHLAGSFVGAAERWREEQDES